MFFDHRQCRVDDAGARAVVAADALAELLDELVAVARLLDDHRENDELQLAAVEHAPLAAAKTAAELASVAAEMPERSAAKRLVAAAAFMHVSEKHNFPSLFYDILKICLDKDISSRRKRKRLTKKILPGRLQFAIANAL